jgi:host factor-I protein
MSGTPPTTEELQTSLLDAVVRDRTPVTIFLASGVRLQGLVLGHDAYTLRLTSADGENAQLVYKHAIAVIAPDRPGQAADLSDRAESFSRAPQQAGWSGDRRGAGPRGRTFEVERRPIGRGPGTWRRPQ